MTVTVNVVTLFPKMFSALNYGVLGRAIANEQLKIRYWDPRDYSQDKHRSVDDRPYGGGPGMVMMAQPLRETLRAIKAQTDNKVTVIYLSPQGKLLTHRGVDSIKQLALNAELVLLCGRYEGIDERFIRSEVDAEWSIGDYVLSGGEFAAMVMIDAIARLLPGTLGHEASAMEDSFATGLLDHPHYTRPETDGSMTIPSILKSGDHEAIRQWRLKQSLQRTFELRPDLLEDGNLQLTEEQQLLLREMKKN